MMRIQVKVLGLFDDVPNSDLPWAEYLLPLACRADEGGHFYPCQVGDWVWVDFPYKGDTRRPRVYGSMHFSPGGTPLMPNEGFDQGLPGTGYHKDVVYSQFGLVEQRKSDGSFKLTQKTTGAYLEITKEGDIKIYSPKTISQTAAENFSQISESDAIDQKAAKNITQDAGDKIEQTAKTDILQTSPTVTQEAFVDMRHGFMAGGGSKNQNSGSQVGYIRGKIWVEWGYFKDHLEVQGITLETHQHKEQGDYQLTSPPVK